MTTEPAETAIPSLEVAELETERLPLSEVLSHPDSPRIQFTTQHLEKLYAVHWWLMEAGEEYREQADILREIYLFLKNILDVEAGIKQGYLDKQAQLPKVV